MKNRKINLPYPYIPLTPKDGDEYFTNGVFRFNVSEIFKDIKSGVCSFELSQTTICEWYKGVRKNLKDENIFSSDLSRPVIIAELCPDKKNYYGDRIGDDRVLREYIILDGHHRIEKASRQGIEILPAYILSMEIHIRYMYSGYENYVDYWNGKLDDFNRYAEKYASVT